MVAAVLAVEELVMGARALLLRTLAVAGVAGSLLALPCSSAVGALVHPFVTSFGSFSNVQGVAVDNSTGDVYVYDAGVGEVLKFNAAGDPAEFTSTNTNAITGAGFPGSAFGELAVDNSSGPAKGDIYVAQGFGNILVFNAPGEKIGELTEEAGTPWSPFGLACGVAVDPSGNVYVGLYEHINKYVPSANPVTNADYASSIGGISGPCNVAADSAGNVFADTPSSGPVTRYEPSQFGSLSATGSLVDSAGSTLALDPANDELYVDHGTDIAQFGAHGEPFEEPVLTFEASGPGAISGSFGIAVSGLNHNVYVSDGAGHLSVFGPAVILPDVTTGTASNLQATSATLSGTVNPSGVPLSECKFEYGTTSAYGQSAPCAESPAEIGSGSSPVPVHADLTGLSSPTYHYRLVAANANGERQGEDQAFTIPFPVIEAEFVKDVASTSATLHAYINPTGKATTYRFEYDTSAYSTSTPHGTTLPTPDGDAGGGTSSVAVSAHPQDLLPSTTYHYRLVAINDIGTVVGVDRTFTTQSEAEAVALLDGRRWEAVSPQDKHGAGIVPAWYEGGLTQAAEDGNAISYLANNPVDGSPDGNRAYERSQTLARRIPGGWSNKTIDTPNEEIHFPGAGRGSEYRMFSPDLSLSVVEPITTTPLAPSATEERTPYVRDEAACKASLSSCFTPLVTSENTRPGVKWDPNPNFQNSEVKFVSASEDLSHVVLSAGVGLLAGDAPGGLYEWSDGRLQRVDVDEHGDLLAGVLGWRNAVSRDGSRIVFSTGGGHLYLREMAHGQTLRLDHSLPSPTFQIATPEDSHVFFSATGGLYECDIVETAGEATCELSTVTGSGDVAGVLGASEDGSSLYFASGAALADGAEPGSCIGLEGASCNLYLAQRTGAIWSVRLVAALEGFYSESDLNDWANGAVSSTANVSSSGRFLAFMSARSLTGYDNRDAASGQRDEEVYLYDAETRRLTCVSCNPTGARPNGWFDEGSLRSLADWGRGIWAGRWLAANIPGWTNIDLFSALHQPRYLSDSGRMFFNSSDALVAHDTNALQDVYEYEPSGVGSCAREAGCVQLISSGVAAEDSVFLDASDSGDDAFFITSARLVSQDEDTAVDVYDAHVCSASAPCTQQPVSPAPCSTGDTCKPPPSPQPSTFGAPPSATYSGIGNLAAPHAAAVTRKALTRTQKLSRALKACKRLPKRKRAACRKRARAKYGSASAHRTAKGGR
jgi:hypothetical protein